MHRRTVIKAGLLSLLPLPKAKAADGLRLAVFPGYNLPEQLAEFAERNGVAITTETFHSNEDLLTACVRGEQFDLITLSHYMVPHYAALGLLKPFGARALQGFAPEHWLPRFAGMGVVNGQHLAVPKNCGTTGFAYQPAKLPELNSWHDFWAAVQSSQGRHTSVLDDVQTVIGSALCATGHSYNSSQPRHILQAEQVLLHSAPFIRDFRTLVTEAVQHDDWLTMAYSDGGVALTRSSDKFRFVNARDGGELWCDMYAIGDQSQQADRVAELIGWLLQPEQIAREVIGLGVSPVDSRVAALLPQAIANNPIIFPSQKDIARLEITNQEALREPLRRQVYDRFQALL